MGIRVVKVIFSSPKHLAGGNKDFCCKISQLEKKKKKQSLHLHWEPGDLLGAPHSYSPPSSAAPFWTMHLDFHPKESSRGHSRHERMCIWVSGHKSRTCVWIKQLRSTLPHFIFTYAEWRWAASMTDHVCRCRNMNMNFLVNLLQNCLLPSQ